MHNDIDILNSKAQYTRVCGKYRHQNEVLITLEHHLRVDIDFQLQKLNNKFCDQIFELLILSSTLCPQDSYSSFEQQKFHLRFQL